MALKWPEAPETNHLRFRHTVTQAEGGMGCVFLSACNQQSLEIKRFSRFITAYLKWDFFPCRGDRFPPRAQAGVAAAPVYRRFLNPILRRSGVFICKEIHHGNSASTRTMKMLMALRARKVNNRSRG